MKSNHTRLQNFLKVKLQIRFLTACLFFGIIFVSGTINMASAEEKNVMFKADDIFVNFSEQRLEISKLTADEIIPSASISYAGQNVFIDMKRKQGQSKIALPAEKNIEFCSGRSEWMNYKTEDGSTQNLSCYQKKGATLGFRIAAESGQILTDLCETSSENDLYTCKTDSIFYTKVRISHRAVLPPVKRKTGIRQISDPVIEGHTQILASHVVGLSYVLYTDRKTMLFCRRLCFFQTGCL